MEIRVHLRAEGDSDKVKTIIDKIASVPELILESIEAR